MGIVTFSALGKMGRQGNQRFQIASTIGIALDNGLPFGFPANPDFPLLPRYELSTRNSYTEPTYEYTPVKLTDDSWDLAGYFQSSRYFAHHWDVIKPYFEFSAEIISGAALLWDEDAESFREPVIGTCSLHVRRGDYVNLQQYHPVLPIEYYAKAISMLPRTASHILVLSDDPAWCKENLGHLHPNMIFITGTEMQDMYLMSQCNYHIIANSSFSWWGAFLNRSEYKQVFAPPPHRWFGEAYRGKNVSDLYEKHWTIVDC